MASIRFRLSARDQVPPFRQLVEQVVNAVRNGRLLPGDRLPSVREVVTQITINPNTVHRAYRELEHLGITEARPGLGTYISPGAVRPNQVENGISSSRDPESWIERARDAGLTDGEIIELVGRLLTDSNVLDRRAVHGHT